MNTVSPQESPTRYYGSRDSVGVWGALVACIGLISTGASLAAHSVAVTSGILIGSIAVWYLGYWSLSKSHYFISSSTAGFRDAFRTRQFDFGAVRSVTKRTGKYSSTLIFVCDARTVAIPFDPIDDAWFSDVRSELHRRGIPVSVIVFGIEQKEMQ